MLQQVEEKRRVDWGGLALNGLKYAMIAFGLLAAWFGLIEGRTTGQDWAFAAFGLVLYAGFYRWLWHS